MFYGEKGRDGRKEEREEGKRMGKEGRNQRKRKRHPEKNFQQIEKRPKPEPPDSQIPCVRPDDLCTASFQIMTPRIINYECLPVA